jgi:hypothetical protein
MYAATRSIIKVVSVIFAPPLKNIGVKLYSQVVITIYSIKILRILKKGLMLQ